VGGVFRTSLLALGLALAWALPAGAAPTWSGSISLSGPGNPITDRPSVAINDGGLGIEAWSETAAGKTGVRVAQHTPGGAWTTFPLTLSGALPGDGCSPFASIDPAGNALVVWSQWAGPGCNVGMQTILFSTRAAGAAAWSAPGVVGAAAAQGDWPMQASSNAAGQMVVGWETNDGANDRVLGAVGSPTGGFIAPTTLYTASMGTHALYYLTTGIGPSGDAAVQWNDNVSGATSNVLIAIKPQAGSFQTTPSLVSVVNAPSSASAGTVAIDAAGDVLSAYLFFDGATMTSFFTTRYRPASVGNYQPQQPISAPQFGFSTSWIAVGFDAGGNATAAWVETNFTPPIPHPRRLFGATRAAGISSPWVGLAPLTDALPSEENTIQLAVAPSGAAAISWGLTTSERSAQALYRPAGGEFGPLTPIGSGSLPTISLAPGGDAAIAFIGASTDARFAVLDVTAPTITAANVPATGSTAAAAPMTTTVSDTWSNLAAGQPSWSFGDGTTGAGLAVSHTYAKAGTYTVTVSAADTAGNAAAPVTRQIAITAPAGPPPPGTPGTPTTSVTKPKLKASYIASKLVGTVTVSGTSGVKTTLTIAVRKRGSKKTSASSKLAVKAGPWSKSIKLPSGLAPGTYDVIVSGSGVKGSQTSFTLAAPAVGIVTRSYASGPRRGPAATRLGRTSELWAHFSFGTLPKKGQRITTQWILPSGSKLGSNTRPRTRVVEAQVKDLRGNALPTGRWRCVIRVAGTVVATLNVRLS
jgi:PKD domain